MKIKAYVLIGITMFIAGCSSRPEQHYRIQQTKNYTHTTEDNSAGFKFKVYGDNGKSDKKLPSVQLSTPSKKEQQAIKQAILLSLKDSDSAKFRGKMILVDKNFACAEVNAKNSYGGYTGFKQIFLEKRKSIWTAFYSSDLDREECIRSLHKMHSISN